MTGKYRGQTPRGRGDSGGGEETLVNQGGRTIGDEGGTPYGIVTGSNKRERARYQNMRQGGKCHTGTVPGRIHSVGLDVDDHSPDTKG